MKNTVLLVVDVQTAVIKEGLYNKENVIDNIEYLISFCRNKDIEVVYVRHDDGVGSELQRNTDSWQIYKKVQPCNNEEIFDKKHNSAFMETDLNKYFEQEDVKTLILVGMQTEYCIDATCKSAFERGYNVIIPEGTNTTFGNEYLSGKELYEFYIKKIWSNRFAEVMSIDNLEKSIDSTEDLKLKNDLHCNINMDNYLGATPLLDFNQDFMNAFVTKHGWRTLNQKEAIISIYNYIQNDIKFGYNIDDAVSASQVLKDGYGQCNTKGILFMSILRSVGIPCRIHGFTIDKQLQKGAMTGITYIFAPKEIVHSWVEVYYNSKWYNLEGFILDKAYLGRLQQKFSQCEGSFCGYGVAVSDFVNPLIDWNENDTYIQSEGIVQDFGVFDSPDELFNRHKQALSPLKKFLYRNFSINRMNKNISKIRDSL